MPALMISGRFSTSTVTIVLMICGSISIRAGSAVCRPLISACRTWTPASISCGSACTSVVTIVVTICGSAAASVGIACTSPLIRPVSRLAPA